MSLVVTKSLSILRANLRSTKNSSRGWGGGGETGSNTVKGLCMEHDNDFGIIIRNLSVCLMPDQLIPRTVITSFVKRQALQPSSIKLVEPVF